MPVLAVTPFYLAAIAILMAALSMRVSILRGADNIALGAGDSGRLALAQRHFGNLSEYAAVVMLLLVVMELQGVTPFWLHIYGGIFGALRLVHVISLFSDMDAATGWRKAGRGIAGLGTVMLLIVGGVTVFFA